ncbi:MAG: glycine cleavage T C-terminal barrel domain-containing protein [Pseudomonadota bacterium]
MVQLSFGARVRKSPFFDSTIKHGVTHFSVYNRMYMATSYGDPKAEYQRLTEGVSLWDVSCERQVEISGPDAAALTQYLCPRDLSTCKIGQGYYVPMCDHDGRIINDPVLLKLAADRFWLSLADSDILLWARAVCAERGFDATVCEPDVSPLAVQGPKAEDVVADVCGDWVRDLKYFWFRETEIDGIPVVVARSGWSKQGGFELYLTDGSRGNELWEIMWKAGEPYGIGPGTPNSTERVESALLSFGTDNDGDANPLELGLGRFVDLDSEADFIGKTALQKIAANGGPARLMTGLLLDGDEPMKSVEHKCPVTQNGRDVGFISTSTYSPRLERNIGIALLETDVVKGADSVVVHTPERDHRGEITSLPF